MALRVRTSKFRHVYGAQTRREQTFENVRITRNTHDSNFCSVNPRFLAVVTESSGGGSFVILDVNRPGRVDINCPKVCGHAGTILDIKWSPFSDFIIASGSEDNTVKIWTVPQSGLLGTLTDWSADLHGHSRRVAYVDWHPTADNVLMSIGFDFKINVWNVEQAEPITQLQCHSDTIHSASWALDGSLIASTSKDKMLRVMDPRMGQVAMQTQGHQSAKTSKAVIVTEHQVFTTGFSRNSDRQYALWDMRKPGPPLTITDLDCSSGILLPYYDPDIQVVYLAGKGDGNIRYFEIVPEEGSIQFLNTYQSALPQRGLSMMPKRGIDPLRNEIARFYKLHASKNLVEPVSMIVPRKAEGFQPDVFPPTSSQIPSLTADEWASGMNRGPILIDLEHGTVLDKPPKTSMSPAVQPQLAALSKPPQITTYKALPRQSPPTSLPQPRAPFAPAPVSFNPNATPASFNPNAAPVAFNPNAAPVSFNPSAAPASFNPNPAPALFNPTPAPFYQPVPPPTSLRTPPEVPTQVVLRSPGFLPHQFHSPGATAPDVFNGRDRSHQEPASIKNIKHHSESSSRALSPASSVSSGHGKGQGRATRSPGSPLSLVSPPPPPSPSSVSQLNGYSGEIPAGDHPHSTTHSRRAWQRAGQGRYHTVGGGRSREHVSALSVVLGTPSDNTHSSAIHVRKVWSPPPVTSVVSPTVVPVSAGINSPSTDSELKKAYFRQLEEIRSLQEQLQLKDRRIKQLEKELEGVKDRNKELGPGESNC